MRALFARLLIAALAALPSLSSAWGEEAARNPAYAFCDRYRFENGTLLIHPYWKDPYWVDGHQHDGTLTLKPGDRFVMDFGEPGAPLPIRRGRPPSLRRG